MTNPEYDSGFVKYFKSKKCSSCRSKLIMVLTSRPQGYFSAHILSGNHFLRHICILIADMSKKILKINLNEWFSLIGGSTPFISPRIQATLLRLILPQRNFVIIGCACKLQVNKADPFRFIAVLNFVFLVAGGFFFAKQFRHTNLCYHF